MKLQASKQIKSPVGPFWMEDPTLEHQQIIAALVAQRPEKIADTATTHWENLADEIISVVGQDGFDSLYERSLHLAQSTIPWLTPDASAAAPNDHRFVEWGRQLASQAPADAWAAHSLLLTLFTDILASLIGEQLTANLLRSAWAMQLQSQPARN
ncbi:MAG: hypothetical protein ACNA7J_04045 [Wenzhouxiangella sp.]